MFEVGDKVEITVGPSRLVNRAGTVSSVFSNGAIINLGNNRFTTVLFTHLRKIEDAEFVMETLKH